MLCILYWSVFTLWCGNKCTHTYTVHIHKQFLHIHMHIMTLMTHFITIKCTDSHVHTYIHRHIYIHTEIHAYVYIDRYAYIHTDVHTDRQTLYIQISEVDLITSH